MPASILQRMDILIDNFVPKYLAIRDTEGVHAKVYNPQGSNSVYAGESDDFQYADKPDFELDLLVGNWFDKAFLPLTGVYIEHIGHEEDGTLLAWVHADDGVPLQHAKLELTIGEDIKIYKLRYPAEGLVKQHDRAVFFRLTLVPFYGAGEEVRE